ncbi:porin [Pontibacter sp. BT731]|uniref:porin n=1 Tax=Pontibacter coccineus TaxID=3063328 RepID=UPI0026E38510|nr:porin [Pontibacter sp. BT731]MDO6391050.1 porin [Pontibacter sp. BT731]
MDSTSSSNNPLDRQPSAYKLSELSRRIDLNFLFRSSAEFPSGSSNQAAVKMNESRIELKGDITPDLSFRVRYRLNRSYAPNSLDNAPGAVDHANVTYRFGNEKKWHLTAGKQAANVGSWEFDTNPTFEYQYSEYVGRQLNLFLLALELGYEVTENHSIQLQLHNTYNQDFNTSYNTAGYAKNGLRPSKTPFGIYVTWLGNMFDNKWQTFYSYNVSQFAKDKTDHAVSIGNKLVLDRFNAYLDLASTNLDVDYANIGSPAVNNYLAPLPAFVPTFLQDINYKTVVLRVDYEFIPKWFITAKGFYETASQRNNSEIGDDFREHYGYWAGLEYKPVANQDMRFFTYYYYNTSRYNNAVAEANADQKLHLFAVGVLYFVNVF